MAFRLCDPSYVKPWSAAHLHPLARRPLHLTANSFSGLSVQDTGRHGLPLAYNHERKAQHGAQQRCAGARNGANHPYLLISTRKSITLVKS
jgi:hypothetical protein